MSAAEAHFAAAAGAPQLKGLAEALAAFQMEMPTVAKSKTAKVPTKSGGSYSYSYADLADVTEVAMPLLSRHGLSFVTLPRQTERGYELVGTLLHVSGERLEGALPIHGNSPQEWGSSLTYARRYLLGSMTGLVTDDDEDGALASSAPPPSRKTKPAPETPPQAGPGEITPKQLGMLQASLKEAGIADRDVALAMYAEVTGRAVESSKALTKREASAVIDHLKGRAEPTPHTDPADDWPPVEEPPDA